MVENTSDTRPEAAIAFVTASGSIVSIYLVYADRTERYDIHHETVIREGQPDEVLPPIDSQDLIKKAETAKTQSAVIVPDNTGLTDRHHPATSI